VVLILNSTVRLKNSPNIPSPLATTPESIQNTMFDKLFILSSRKNSQSTAHSSRSSLSGASTRYDVENHPNVVPDQSRKSSRGSIGRFDTIETVVDRTAEPTESREKAEAANTTTRVEVAAVTLEAPRHSRPWYHPISLFWLVVENWFLIGIAVFISLAWRWPELGKDGGSESPPPCNPFN